MRAASRRLWAFYLLLFFFFALVPPALAVEGTFEGRIVDAPPDQPLPRGWIFVLGRNHLMRRVEVAHATIVFGVEVPASERKKCGPECLGQGLDVKVTAEQDSHGEWRAKRVEILHLATRRA